MTRQEEFAAKLARVRALLSEQHLGAAILSRRSNFAWLTCGGQNHVAAASEFGAGSLIVTRDQVFLLSNNIENTRLFEEECHGLSLVPLAFPWHLESVEKPSMLQMALGSFPFGSDGIGGGTDLSAGITQLRHPLLNPEVDRYRALGREAEEVMNRVCRSLRKGMTEYQVAAELAAGCLDRGMDSTVRLIAFDERIDRFRHPVPTGKTLEERALVALGARRSGLIVSLSRMVSLKPISEELRRRHEAVCRIDTVFNLSSQPGATLGGILSKGIAQYEREGFGDEWHLHHQGGLTGYEGRDVRATPECKVALSAPTAVAWNPSITGTKSEDTFLVTENGVENLTASSDWPKVRAETDIGMLERYDILEVS
jgi:Xaa-Pro aminopeptidase